MTKLAFLFAGLSVSAAACVAFGQQPPDMQEFAITPQVGAFTICAASYSGDLAAKMAHDLAVELRTQYRLQAYIFNRGAELRRQQEEEIQKKREEQRQSLIKMGASLDIKLRTRRVHIDDQYAVLIGGYKDMEAARKELNRIKGLQPPKSVPGERLTVEVVPTSAEPKKFQPQQREVNPFQYSFVAPNPTVQAETDAGKPDPFWKKLNAGESYSLLNCKKPWTLAIKEYQQATVLRTQAKSSTFLKKLWGDHLGAELNANAMSAHNLAEGMRKLGFKSYVLHTRSTSIVTIGEFDRKDDPRMQEVIRALANNVQLDAKLQLFPNPMPMPVPRFEN